MDYHKAFQCAVLSKEAYLNFSPELRFSAFPHMVPQLIEGKKTDTQCVILINQGEARTASPSPLPETAPIAATAHTRPNAAAEIFIVFRGSDSDTDWGINFNFQQAAVQYFKKEAVKEEILAQDEKFYPYAVKSQSGAQMHRGFTEAYGTVRQAIHAYIEEHPALRITVTGHSLGGAVATLCAVDLQYNFGDRLQALQLYTFGSPRVGNNGFRESFNRRVPESCRFVYGMDMVPAFPRHWQQYRHVDQECRLGKRVSWDFLLRRFRDHAIDNYIAALREKASLQPTPSLQAPAVSQV